MHKTEPTIQPTDPKLVAEFQKQEFDRYNRPLYPFEYRVDSKVYSVGPIIRFEKQIKWFFHRNALLIDDRPIQVTLMAIIRDAASRLPDNVGTRADVACLMMDSSYIASGVTLQLCLTIYITKISKALDKLSKESDPSVRWDKEKKLWVYLHNGREVHSPQWQLDVDEEL